MAEQCKGITKKGIRCKNSLNLIDGYCKIHLEQLECAKPEKEIPATVDQHDSPRMHPVPPTPVLHESNTPAPLHGLRILISAIVILTGLLTVALSRRLRPFR
jgi:hypothetical protein